MSLNRLSTFAGASTQAVATGHCRVFQSNLVEHLALQLGKERRARLARSAELLPRPEVVLVQNYGMAQWLKQALARTEGIATDLQFMLPAAFVWQLYVQLLKGELAPTPPYSRPLMTWRLVRLMEAAATDQPALEQYLQGEGDRQLRCLQLAEAIADLFDKYLVYRPDWIHAWEKGEPAPVQHQEGNWLAALWRLLVQDYPTAEHRVALDLRLRQRLGQPLDWPDTLPLNLSVFGLSSLAPSHLETLAGITTCCNLDIYLMNPCQHYWGSLVTERTRAKQLARQVTAQAGLTDDHYWMVGNPLLANFGRQGRDFIELLLHLDAEFIDLFVDPAPDSALKFLQREILNQECAGQLDPPETPSGTEAGRFKLSDQDRSLSCHICRSPLREVEVLHQAILAQLTETDTDPSDIIVMMPDVSTYAAAIEAVFNSEHPVPFSLVEQPADEGSGLISHILRLLNLSASRFTATEMADLLQLPAVRRKLNLENEDIQQIREWISACAIRWGLGPEQRLPDCGLAINTWQTGLQRLWLSYSMSGDPQPLHEGLLGIEEMDEYRLSLLVRLQTFIDTLVRWHQVLQDSYPAATWVEQFTRLQEAIYEPEDRDLPAMEVIRSAMANLVEEISVTGFDKPLSEASFRHRVTQLITRQQQAHNFLARGVTFCGLLPMRSIPARMLCLLGLNDRDFPRCDPRSAIDLMQQQPPRTGDRSRQQDDRYLFLELLLSARQRLHLSYSGEDQRRKRETAPATVLAELLDYWELAFTTNDGESPRKKLVVEHPLQPFSPDYFEANPLLVSFSQTWFRAAENWQVSQANGNAPPSLSARHPDEPASLPPELELESLCRFLAAPQRWYLERILDIRFEADSDRLEDEDPYAIGGLAEYQLKKLAVEELLLGVNEPDLLQRLLASGRTLPGEAGRLQAQEVAQAATQLAERVSAYRGEGMEWRRIDLQLAATRLTGQVQVWGDNQVQFRPGAFKPHQLLTAWALHLACNAEDKRVATRLLSTQGSWHLLPLGQQAARTHLHALIEMFAEGQLRPVPFFPATTFYYCQARQDSHVPGRKAPGSRRPSISNQALVQRELDTFHVRRTFEQPTEAPGFQTWLEKIADPLMAHLEAQV